MSQYMINIGALPNDGTGDPLRTAFNETNLNFDQVFAAGPVLSNIRIANNTILTTNTNGNLVLAPNGVGVIQSNQSIIPSIANVRNLGSSSRRWSQLYVQYVNVSGNIDLAGSFNVGDLTVNGNLTVTGNTIQIGNIVTDTKTIQLSNTATSGNAANGSGITVGANDDIATFLFDNTNNSWATNIGLQVNGGITGTSIAVSDATVYGTVAGVTGTFSGNLSAGNILIGNTLFTRTLTVGRDTTSVTVPLASNNSFNVFTQSGNVVVYTT
jgi:hypothetical protein